jgi:hypothetical protein
MDVDSRDETEGMSAAQIGDSDDDEPVQSAKSGKGGKKGLSDIENEEGSDREETGGAGSKVSHQAVREGPICKPVIPCQNSVVSRYNCSPSCSTLTATKFTVQLI